MGRSFVVFLGLEMKINATCALTELLRNFTIKFDEGLKGLLVLPLSQSWKREKGKSRDFWNLNPVQKERPARSETKYSKAEVEDVERNVNDFLIEIELKRWAVSGNVNNLWAKTSGSPVKRKSSPQSSWSLFSSSQNQFVLRERNCLSGPWHPFGNSIW